MTRLPRNSESVTRRPSVLGSENSAAGRLGLHSKLRLRAPAGTRDLREALASPDLLQRGLLGSAPDTRLRRTLGGGARDRALRRGALRPLRAGAFRFRTRQTLRLGTRLGTRLGSCFRA